MEKITLYKIAVVGLIVLNLVLVLFLWLGRPRAGERTFAAIERFELTQDQRESFQESVKAHKRTLRQIEEEQKPILEAYFRSLKVPADSSAPTLPAKLLELEKQKIQHTYEHLLSVKGILNEEQLAEYPAFIDFVIRQVLEKKGRKPPPKKN